MSFWECAVACLKCLNCLNLFLLYFHDIHICCFRTLGSKKEIENLKTVETVKTANSKSMYTNLVIFYGLLIKALPNALN